MEFTDDYVEGAGDAIEQTKRVKHENALKTHAEDIKWMMSSPKGRRIAWWLMDKAGVSRTSFAGNDALRMAFNEGGRNLGLTVQAQIIEHCPERYVEMLNERNIKVK